MLFYNWFTVAIVFCFNFNFVWTKYIEGTLTSSENWEFLTRFCFKSIKGTLQYEFEYEETYATQNLLLYWDAPFLWSSVYNTEKSCADKQRVLKESDGQIQKLNTVNSYSSTRYSCERFTKGDSDKIYQFCKTNGQVKFRSTRETWWFLAIANCEGDKGLHIKYKVWMRNSEVGDTFYEHFSADEFYILQTNIAFLLATAAIFVLSLFVAVKLHEKQLFHSTYRIYIISLVCHLWYLFFTCVLWGIYAKTGEINLPVKYSAEALGALGQILFIAMLLLLALGYTVVCGKLPIWMIVLLVLFILGYTIANAVLFFYEAAVHDPGLVLHRYESDAGTGLIILMFIACVVFLISCAYTMIVHKKKQLFYVPFMIFMTAWFCTTPSVIVISFYHIPLWMREKIVNGVHQSVMFLGFLIYLIITRPTAANSNFPFHIKTGQVDAITLEMAETKAEEEEAGGGQEFTDLSMFCVTGNTQAPREMVPRSNGVSRPATAQTRSSETNGAPPPISFDAMFVTSPRATTLPPL